MRTLIALTAATVLGLSACSREAGTRADASDATDKDTTQELAEASQAVGEAAVQVGQAARVAITDAAVGVEQKTAETQQEQQARPEQP